MSLIEATAVSKLFRRHKQTRLLREHMWDLLRRSGTEAFYALKEVSFRIDGGRSVGIVGHNGAGKSTLLGLLAGVTRPDAGTLRVNGRVAALLELGSGFHPDLTGRENCLLNASLLGFTRKRARRMMDEIIEFADIGDFVNEPLRTYSSGMTLRLAFAVAIHAEPDVMLIDEILAVGDQNFQAKCYERIKRMRASGVTLVCVSHQPEILHEFCDTGLWLDHGQLVMEGAMDEILSAYSGVRTRPA